MSAIHTADCQEVQAAHAAWVEQWPGYCRHCAGGGIVNETGYSWDEPPNADPCPQCTEQGICARCGAKRLTEDGDGPCGACGWNYDDCEPAECICPDEWPYEKAGSAMSEHDMDWREIGRQLVAPFEPSEVEWIVTGKQGPNAHAQVAAYIDARCVQDRLDSVVGPGAWAFEWQPLQIDAKGNVLSAKGILSIHGVSKADVGTASNFEPSKGAVSDALKRAAVQWGIGRYLYSLPKVWTTLDGKGQIPEDFKRKLADGLRRHAGQQPAQQPAQTQAPAQSNPKHEKPTKPARPATQEQLNRVAAGCKALGKPLIEVRGYDHAVEVLASLETAYREKQAQATPRDLSELETGARA